MKLRRSVSRRTYIISVTLFVLVAMFGYYFLAFLPKKENQLIAQRVRALDRIGQNFQEKFNVYRKNVLQNIKDEDFAVLDQALQQADYLEKQQLSRSGDSSSSEGIAERLKTARDTIQAAKKRLWGKYSLSATNRQISLIEEFDETSQLIRFENTFATLFSTFFAPIRLQDSFDGYVIYQDSSLVYQDLPGEILRVPAQLYTELSQDSPEGQFVRHNLESREPEHYETPRVYEAGTNVQLASVDYRLFCTDFTTNDKRSTTRWIIYGLVTKDAFDAEKKRIPFLSLVLLSLGLLLLLFSMPLMKLFFMSSIERLHRQDALLTPPTFIVCSAICLLIMLTVSKFYLSDIPRVDTRLKKLANEISRNFQDEVQDIYQLAQQMPTDAALLASNKSISIPNAVANNTTSLPDFNQYPFLRSVYWLNGEGKQKFEYSMLDSEDRDYTEKKLPDFANRSYFRVMQQGEGYSLVDKDTLAYLQSIVSWTTGEPVSVFSVALSPDNSLAARGSKNSSVLAISTVLQSVTDPVLPPGYSFHIMDESGLVLYHTDRQKNLQENFLEEIADKQPLMAAMVSRSTTTTDISYYNRNYRARLQPMPGTPWCLVTTYDTEYLESPYQYILTFCTLGIILISLISALQFVSIALLYHRPSKLKRTSVAFKWLWPYQNTLTPLNKKNDMQKPRTVRYGIIFVLNLVYGLLLIFYNQSADVSLPVAIASFLMAIVLSYTATFALLQEHRDRRYKMVLIGSVLLSLLVLLMSILLTMGEKFVEWPHLLMWVGVVGLVLGYVSWKALQSSDSNNAVEENQWIRTVLQVGVVMLGLLLLGGLIEIKQNTNILQQGFVWAILYLMALLAFIVGNTRIKSSAVAEGQARSSAQVSGFTFSINRLFDKKLGQIISQILTRHGYCLMVFSYLVLSSILSVWFLFSKTYDYEKRIWSKYSLYQINQELNKRESRLHALYQRNNSAYHAVNEKYGRYQRAKNKALYYQALGIDSGYQAETEMPLLKTNFDELVYQIRPAVTTLSGLTNGFVGQQGDDWVSQSFPNKVSVTFPESHYFDEAGFLTLSMSPSVFLNMSWANLKVRHLVLLVVFALLLLGIYYLLKFSIFRLFGVQAFHFQKVIQVDDQLMIEERENPKLSRSIQSPHKFIISMPFAGTRELYEKPGIKHKQSYDEKFDFSQVLENTVFPLKKEKILQLKDKDVVLEHFSYGIEDPKTNEHRLFLLENLLANGNRVTIISKLAPMQLTAKFEEIIENAADPREVEDLETRVSRWKDILSSFVKLYYSELVCSRNRRRLGAEATIAELVYHEMSVNKPYFRRMDGTLVSKWYEDDEQNKADERKKGKKIELSPLVKQHIEQHSDNEDAKEEILLKIQSMAQPFYFSLWSTCSKEEKYVLYDLADDGFVNTKDKSVMLALMEKGLIFYDESFHIMNESFRNFILSNIKPAEALEMEQAARKNGRWSVYSTVILLLIVSLVFFVVFAHESIVNQFVALLAGVTAAVPYLLRLVGLIGLSGGNRESAA